MNGVFINITNRDIIVDNMTIPHNKELITQYRDEMLINNAPISAVISTPLTTPLGAESNTYSYVPSGIFANSYKMIRDETQINLNVPTVQKKIKYSFTNEQIEIINNISKNRTRLFIVTEEDADCWLNGRFECPFRNYRIFICRDGRLLEHVAPRSVADIIISGIKSSVFG
jgi:hypothetical protein